MPPHVRSPLLLAILATVTLTVTPAFAAEDLTIESGDGFELAATYYAGAADRPGILLLHQCNRDRASLAPVATELARRGFHVLALDFRGFGDSVDDEVTEFRLQSATLLPLWPADVDAALETLLARPGVRRTAVGALGASCGGSQQVLLSMREPRVAALAFLSSSVPWVAEAVRAEFLDQRDMPLLVIAAEDDTGTAEVARELFQGSANGRTQLLMYKGNTHGAPLFEQDPSLPGIIADWFARQF